MPWITDDRGRRRFVNSREYIDHVIRQRQTQQRQAYQRQAEAEIARQQAETAQARSSQPSTNASAREVREYYEARYGSGAPTVTGSGYDQAEQNRFRTLSEINSRGNRAPGSTLPIEPLDDRLPPDATGSEVEAFIREKYGYFAAFLDIPEVGEVLLNAARNGWGEAQLQGALHATDWWQQTSAAQRTWIQLQSEDPAEARRQVAQTAAAIQNRARSLGLPSSVVADIATQATIHGWTDEQSIDALIAQVDWSSIEGGDLTAMRDDVSMIGSQYLVNVSDQTAQNYAARIASGEMTMDGVRSIMQQQARARFGWMAEQLDAGVTVVDYLAPVRDQIARELEIVPDAVDLMDPKWLSMVETRGDDGQMRAATLHEAQLAARKRPEWAETSNAQETTNQMMTLIGSVFGRGGIR